MVSAATRAMQSGNPSAYENKQYRTFIFNFAHMFLHEMGHLFVTFLTRGQKHIPDPTRALLGGYIRIPNLDDAGRDLEKIIFGGTVEYYRDSTHGEEQVRLFVVNRCSGLEHRNSDR